MPEWIMFLLGIIAGVSVVSAYFKCSKQRNRVQGYPAKALEYDRSPATVLNRRFGCPIDRITVRPLIPADISKTSWEWQDNEEIRTSACQVLELTGIDCGKWAAVSIFNNKIGAVRIGLLTSWDNSASVIIKPQETVYLRKMEVGDGKTDYFALKGRVYEPEGAYIA